MDQKEAKKKIMKKNPFWLGILKTKHSGVFYSYNICF